MDYKDNLLGVLQTLFKWKKQIFYICLFTFIGSALSSWFLLDNYYQATTVFYPASPDIALPKTVGQAVKQPDYYGAEKDLDRILTIAESSKVANYIIKKFSLYEHYDIDTNKVKAPHLIQKKFKGLYNVKKTKFDAIEISIEDKDITFPAQMVNTARDYVNEIGQNLIKEGQHKEMKTYEAKLTQGQAELNILSDSLSRIRKKYGIYNTESQGEVLASMVAKAESTLVLNKAKKNSLKDSGTRFRDTLTLLNAVIKGQEQQVININEKINRFNDGFDQVVFLQEVHEEASKQLSLSKERFKQLRSAYHADVSAIHLVEAASKPLAKSRPMRSIICIAAVLIAFLFSIIGILLIENYKDVNWQEIINAK